MDGGENYTKGRKGSPPVARFLARDVNEHHGQGEEKKAKNHQLRLVPVEMSKAGQ